MGDFPWTLGVYDAHCHPTETPGSLGQCASMKTRALTVMATNGQDQDLVANIAKAQPSSPGQKGGNYVVPSFGWHPWFSHQVYDDTVDGNNQPLSKDSHYASVLKPQPTADDVQFLNALPEPRSLRELIHDLRSHLKAFPEALIGEVGLDRSFRIPWPRDYCKDQDHGMPGGGRALSPYRVDVEHQKKVLTAQLRVAGEMGRAVSVHGVAVHGVLFHTLASTWAGKEIKRANKAERRQQRSEEATFGDSATTATSLQSDHSASFPPRICLHSYSGPPDVLKQYLNPSIPVTIYFSFSILVNLASEKSNKSLEVIQKVPDDRILAESDLHAAGRRMDELMEEVIRRICQLKGWTLRQGISQMASNWHDFVGLSQET